MRVRTKVAFAILAVASLLAISTNATAATEDNGASDPNAAKAVGYWVPQAPKMGYKARFLPLEILLEGRWQRLTRALTDAERQELIDTLSRPTTVSDYRRRAAG